MFIALRDLAYAKGRFLLMGQAVVLLLGGLAAGVGLAVVHMADGRLKEVEGAHAAH